MSIIHVHNKATNTTYVYESVSYWVPELGQARSKRKCIGKLDPKTGNIIPCGERGRKKQKKDQINADDYEKLKKKYEQSADEVAQLRMTVSELGKKLSDATKNLSAAEKQIQKLVGAILE